jgi:hypothetical protein
VIIPNSASDGGFLPEVKRAELKRFAQTVVSGGFDKPVFDKPLAAAFLCIKGRTLDDWMRRKRVPFSKLPSGAVRFRRDQLVEFLKKYEVA